MPFFTGTRSCIGNKLALIEFKILLSMLIRNFVFQPVEGLYIRKRYSPATSPDPYVKLIVTKVEN
jgi:cytochrome P450